MQTFQLSPHTNTFKIHPCLLGILRVGRSHDSLLTPIRYITVLQSLASVLLIIKWTLISRSMGDQVLGLHPVSAALDSLLKEAVRFCDGTLSKPNLSGGEAG